MIGFLARWSRLKRAARTPPGGQTTAAEPALSPAEIAALPRIEELTASSSLAPFMRRGVPAQLRNAALRRMWKLDPAIRCYVGHARDYAYDWNTPGGVPGHGTIEPSEVAEMLRGLLGEPGPVSDTTLASRTEPGLTAGGEAIEPTTSPRRSA